VQGNWRRVCLVALRISKHTMPLDPRLWHNSDRKEKFQWSSIIMGEPGSVFWCLTLSFRGHKENDLSKWRVDMNLGRTGTVTESSEG
jgi:hypothetical protein